ncbi:bifunctional (p)ppGpp synthetase/guanosine-3',5'-bis(diphosphate) 3'-pyrophosphohydrolase [archaeon]|jgi:(p)ppGpp synthase/HD superfamily hydrolase|nr:bifunctional (p)ppGpp synthetase/guanosine-3',5'-bis(diphosphate) 3'-pyrophosphohydrolase [archaeon]
MERITKAFEFAHEAHLGQKRKGTGAPYIIHPMEVSIILMKNNATPNAVIAGLLHDTVEDTDTTMEDIEKEFGRGVAELVRGATEPSKLEKKKITIKPENIWKTNKSHTIKFIKTANRDMKMLSCADKLSNIRTTIEDHKIMGEKVWEKFHAPKEEQKWYYISMCKSFNENESIADTDMYTQFKKAVMKIFGEF